MAESDGEIKKNESSEPLLATILEVWGQTGKQSLIPITGRSMLPLLRKGDSVVVAHGGANVRRGAVIVFRQEGKLIAHRVMRILETEAGPVFLTKGDNVAGFDPPVQPQEFVGRVLSIKRGSTTIALDTAFWRTVGWVIMLSTLPLADLYEWARRVKRRRLGVERHPIVTPVHQKLRRWLLLPPKIIQFFTDRRSR